MVTFSRLRTDGDAGCPAGGGIQADCLLSCIPPRELIAGYGRQHFIPLLSTICFARHRHAPAHRHPAATVSVVVCSLRQRMTPGHASTPA